MPQYVKTLSPRQICIFIDWYWMGDGTTVGARKYKDNCYRGTRVIYTSSRQMADDLQELALLSGHVGRIRNLSQDSNLVWRNSFGKRPFYSVTIGKPMEFSAGKAVHEEYDGYVWCPTTKNGIVYVRRNGKAAWVGNCWYFKRRIQEIEGIGIERDLAGFPVLTAPEGLNIWDEDDPDMVAIRVNADKIVQNIRRDSMEGLTVPNGWTLQLLSTGGSRQFDTTAVIERYDSRIAMTVLADFILMGHQSVGSFALSSDKMKVFAMAVGAYLDGICEVFNNKAILDLIDINGDRFAKITDYPTLEHGDVEDANLDKVGDFISKTVNCGALLPDESLDDYLRQIAGMPERMDEWETAVQTAASAAASALESRRRQDGETDENTDSADDEETAQESEDEADVKKAKNARRRLGRD